jgi:ATP-dependent RNA circularization protein (DNA/RNA ligase family)
MFEYPKIQTLFKRDFSTNKIIESEYTLDEFRYLEGNQWECTEKIDGTNTSVVITKDNIEFHGRTENAVIPTELLDKLHQLFPVSIADDIFGHNPLLEEITLFGEGYGRKIQSGGRYIADGVNFILFDVRIDKWWLTRKSVEDIAANLGIDVVPLIGMMTIPEAIQYVKDGFKSLISEDKTLNAEGLVLKTPVGLLGRDGNRIITKIKTKDFR